MAIAFFFDSKHKVLLARFEGALTDEAIEALWPAARAFAAIHGNCSGIVDLSAVGKIEVDIADLRAFGRRPRVMAGVQRVLVAPGDEMFGMIRMYGLQQSSTLDDEPMVVRSLQEAYDLLGLQDPDFQPITLAGGSSDPTG
jgi:hypothetical protein